MLFFCYELCEPFFFLPAGGRGCRGRAASGRGAARQSGIKRGQRRPDDGSMDDVLQRF